MAKIKYEGKVLNGWAVGAFLDAGGNGIVHQVLRGDQEGAVKILKRELWTGKRYTRFKDEIEGMKRCEGIPGVVPLLDFSTPEAPTDDNPPCIVMGLAQPLTYALAENPRLEQIVEVCSGIAEALTAMHEIGIAHRDIKPDNLFRYRDHWSVGDLGLADFEGKSAVTAEGEKIGPIYYIAPEMLNNSHTADGKPADVYSLAKTLWVLGTGQRFPLPGQMRIEEPAYRLSTYVAHSKAKYLEVLIENATRLDPLSRPTMVEMARELQAWLSPAVEANSIQDLSDVIIRLTAVREPALRAEQLKNRYVEGARDALETLKRKLEPITAVISKAAGVGGTPPIYFRPVLDAFPTARAFGSPDILWSDGHCITLETPGDLPVRYFCGVGVEVFDNADLRIIAAHMITVERIKPDVVWAEDSKGQLGSIEIENAMSDLINGLSENLPRALDRYVNTIEGIRR